jgi:hypothetical protein
MLQKQEPFDPEMMVSFGDFFETNLPIDRSEIQRRDAAVLEDLSL